MKLLSRLFRRTPPPRATPASEPVPAPPAPAAPAVDPQQQQRLLHDIESGALDAAGLMRLAVEGQTTRVRQAAASAVQDPALWQALLPRLRGRDKAAYRLTKERLDKLQAEQRSREQARLEAEALCAAIEKHATRAHDGRYASTLATHEARWNAMPAAPDAALRERGARAIEGCREVIAAHEREAARLAAEREAEQARVRAREAELRAQQQAAEEQAAIEARERAALEEAHDAQARTEADEAADDAAAAADVMNEKQAAAAQIHAEVASLIRLSGAALTRGETRKSARFRQSIEAALGEAPALPPHLARSLEQLDARLNELRQWKDYVAAPKRIELIEEVEALIGVEEPPEALVDHLRALRDEWRTINKGISVDATAESERFEQAWAAAFEPCKAYLAGQAAMRRANLEARRHVLERVLAFEAGLDAAQPDHSLMLRVLREAPQAWRTHAPVDRDAGRALDADFFGALDRLRARLNDLHAANAAAKQALLARALQLKDTPGVAEAIDEAKRLQSQWKATGPVPHAQSQSLWEEFRAACNAVFERRNAEVAQQAAVLEQAKAAAEDLCAQIEQASGQGPADRPTGEAQLRAWQEAFHALGEFPRQDARALHERYQRAMSAYDAQIAGLAQRDAEALETNVLAAARYVRAYQRAVIEADAAHADLKASAEAFIDGVPRWPDKGVLQVLRQALARADSPEFTTSSDAQRELALRRLCIHAEILGDCATPPEDATLRREQEMQLLSQGLGQKRQADERVWEAMRLEWLGLDAAPPAVHDGLERRFMRCLTQRRRAVHAATTRHGAVPA